jgi:hypothetical protein
MDLCITYLYYLFEITVITTELEWLSKPKKKKVLFKRINSSLAREQLGGLCFVFVQGSVCRM